MASQLQAQARRYLAGGELTFEAVNGLWKGLKKSNDISLARRILERLRQGKGLIDRLPPALETRRKLCRQEALLTSKDSELIATRRHDRALEILEEGFGSLDDQTLNGDAETAGIAGGILKRRWNDLGRLEDLRQAARYYERGAIGDLGEDGYAHINAAFLEDLLAHAGDAPDDRRLRASTLRQSILEKLPAADSVGEGVVWFNTATRAEALFGLRRYDEATRVVAACTVKPEPWELETTARQIATIAHLQHDHPLDVADVRKFFDALLPGAADAARSAVIGKVGLALSGGGFRASFYHLGVLARLAELNVLRHVDVLSCVSGGSIVGACYWLALRNRMMQPGALTHQDYIELVQKVIDHFVMGVEGNLRGGVQAGLTKVIWGLLFDDQRGALDPERTAKALHETFYQPLLKNAAGNCMHDLPFKPADHNEALTNSPDFHPGQHNWLRANKVPVLVLNATTVNTGHAWQFTPTWMGESPWAVHEAADSIPRLEWSWYAADSGWKMEIGRAVARPPASPGFSRRCRSRMPIRLDTFTPDESNALMACGYQMATWAYQRDLARIKELSDPPRQADWPFMPMVAEITSTDPPAPRRQRLLDALRKGSAVRLRTRAAGD